MTTLLAFVFGVFLGLGIDCWNRYRLKQQLRQMLCSLTNAELVPSMSSVSLVRREVVRLVADCQQREEELQTWYWLLDQAAIGYLRVDEENQLLWCNAYSRQLLKIDRWQQGQVRLLLELVRSYELDQLIEKTRKRQQPQTREWVYYNTSHRLDDKNKKTQLTLKASSYPLAQGHVSVFLENLQPLVELSQSRDRAFSDLAHELRTPLTSMALVAEALEKRLQNSERRWVEQMQQETARLIQLVQSWLEISQLNEDPARHLDCQPVELREVLFSCWQTLAPLAQKKAVSLNYSGPESILLQADASRLSQVFLNLFDNGIKHSSTGGNIDVSVTSVASSEDGARPQIQIDIIDSGGGFIEADLPHIFKRLYRGEPSRARLETEADHHGSGLGLSIVQQIVQAHGGSIAAKNHPLGGGWLQVTLPAQ
ncbi:MAG: sensor histidine kinase [Cyanophyceae cyanobacterium]